jgi:hypothetical protein
MGSVSRELVAGYNLAHTIQYGTRPFSLGAFSRKSQIDRLRGVFVE